MPGELTKDMVVGEIRRQMLLMQFDVPVINESGDVVGTTKSPPTGAGIEQFATSIGTAIFNILKTQVIVDVTTTGGPGTGKIR